jgi:ABC-type spermidine/putrescine transport system permease subunit II
MVAGASIAVASVLLYLQLYIERRGLRAGSALLALSLVLPPCLLAFLTYSWNYSIHVSPVWYLKELPELLRDDLRIEVIQKTFACPLICVVLAVACSVLAALRIRFLLDMQALERQREDQAVPGSP